MHHIRDCSGIRPPLTNCEVRVLGGSQSFFVLPWSGNSTDNELGVVDNHVKYVVTSDYKSSLKQSRNNELLRF